MSNTYRYYGTVESRGRNYRQLPNPKPKANLGEGRSAKNLEQQLAEQGVKANKNQDIRLLAAQEAVKNTNFDAFKKFSDEQIRQMFPDDPQLANYLINGKNDAFMRESKSLNEDAIAYEKKHGKVSDADVDSIIDAAIQKRDKKSLEDMGILTNDAIERWIDRHPSNSGFGKTGNILKSWRDDPAKYVIKPEATDTNNTSKSAETNVGQPATNPEKQAAQGMVDNSYVPYEENIRKQGIAKSADYPEFTELPMSNYYPLAYADGVYTPHGHNKDLNYSNTRHASNYPTRNYLYLDGQYPFNAYEGMGNVEFVPMYNPHYPRERLFSRPEGYYPNPFEKRRYDVDIQRYPAMSETQRKLRDTAEVLGLGLGGIGLVGYIGGQQAQERQKQSQTQAPYRMEPEPANEAVAQAELTPEQQFVLQSTSPFDYAKGANLFDLYSKYGSPNNEESIAEAINESVSPQVLSSQEGIDLMRAAQDAVNADVYRRYLDRKNQSNSVSSQESPEVVEASEDLNDASEVQAVKDTAQSAYKKALKRSKHVPVTSEESAGPVVLNVSRQHKTRDVQNNSITPEQAAASQMVNQYTGIPAEVVRAKNQPFLTTDAIWNRLRQKGLVSPEEGIRSGLFTPDEVRYITENDLWRYR